MAALLVGLLIFFFQFLAAQQNSIRFRIQFATNSETEKHLAKIKYLSIRSLLNLNVEMACFNQLAQMHKFPLCDNILHPAINVPAAIPPSFAHDCAKYVFVSRYFES